MRTALLVLLSCASAFAQFVTPTNGSNYKEHADNAVDQNATGFASPTVANFLYQDTGNDSGGVGAVTNGYLVAVKNLVQPELRVYDGTAPLWTDATANVSAVLSATYTSGISNWSAACTFSVALENGSNAATLRGTNLGGGGAFTVTGNGSGYTTAGSTTATVTSGACTGTATISIATAVFGNGASATTGTAIFGNGPSTPAIDANGQICMADAAEIGCLTKDGILEWLTAVSYTPHKASFALVPSSDGSKITVLGGGPMTTYCVQAACGSYTLGQQVGNPLYPLSATSPGTGTSTDYYANTNDACSISDVIYYDGQNTSLSQPNNTITAVQISNTGPIEIAQSAKYDGPSQASPMCHGGTVFADGGNGGGATGTCNSSSNPTYCIVGFSTTPSGTSLPNVCSTGGAPGVLAPGSTGTSFAWSSTLNSVIAHFSSPASSGWYVVNPSNCAWSAVTPANFVSASNMSSVCAPNCRPGSEQEIVPCPGSSDDCMFTTLTQGGGTYPSAAVGFDFTACTTVTGCDPLLFSYALPLSTGVTAAQYTSGIGNWSASCTFSVATQNSGIAAIITSTSRTGGQNFTAASITSGGTNYTTSGSTTATVVSGPCTGTATISITAGAQNNSASGQIIAWDGADGYTRVGFTQNSNNGAQNAGFAILTAGPLGFNSRLSGIDAISGLVSVQ